MTSRTEMIAAALPPALILIALIAPAGLPSASVVQAESRVPQLSATQDTDPDLPVREVRRHLPDHWKAAWLDALASPELDLRREAAVAFLQEHRQQDNNLEGVGKQLISAFDATKHPEVRLTIASALVEFNHRAAAERLFALSQKNSAPASVALEATLARWDYAPARETWLRRLENVDATPRRRLLAAIDGVRQVGETRAVKSLTTIVMDPLRTSEVRLPAAEALGALQGEGLVNDAKLLASDSSPTGITGRLMAVSLLAKHQTEPARDLLRQLALDQEPTVARRALKRLLEIDPDLVRPLVSVLMKNSDGPVRRLAVQSLIDRTVANDFQILGEFLNDRHPDVRRYVRESLRQHADREEFNEIVRSRAMEILEGDDWRGQEQAGLLLVDLDDKEAVVRLLKLLESDRPEVYVTAAWGLRELAVEETLPEMLRFVERLLKSNEGRRISTGHDVCLSHLFEAFGQMKYSEAEPVMLTFVPRRYDMGARSRGAATWAIGLLHEDDPQPELLALLGDRVRDEGTIPAPEAMEVRVNAAISIGRMKARAAIQGLTLMRGGTAPGSRLNAACTWALEQITGEDFPDPEPFDTAPKTPFLQPLD